MKRETNIAVIGTGVLSLSIAGQMAQEGKVTFIDIKADEEALNRLNKAQELIFRGAVNYTAKIERYTSDFELAAADIIAVTVSASSFSDVFTKLLPRIRDGQHIIFFPGSFGAMLFKSRLESESQVRNITISEAVSFPYVTELQDFQTMYVHSVKKELKIASCPQSQSRALCDFYNRFFNIFTCGQSLLETSLENINSVLHPLPILLNVAAVENNSPAFKHFIQGVTPLIGSLLEQMDEERLNVGKAYGLQLVATLEQLKSYYGQNEAQNLYEYVAGQDSPYKDISGFGLQSRYIVEDIPYLVVPTLSLGQAAQVKMPVFALVVNLAEMLLKEDFKSKGFSIKRLGLEGLTMEMLQQSLRGFQ